MGLGKILRLGGIDNSAPKTDQSIGRFRVARNVMPTPDGTIIPRYDYNMPGTQAPSVREYMHITEYDGEPLSVIAKNPAGTGLADMSVYKAGVRIPMWIPPAEVDFTTPNRSQLPVSNRVNNTTYIHTPYTQGTLMKYDGVEFGPAGCPILKIAAAVPLTSGRFLRVVFHTIDFDNNEPVSEYIQLTATGSVNFYLNGQTPAGYADLPDAISGTSPSSWNDPSFPTYNSFEGTGTFSAVNDEISITTTSNSIVSNDQIGSYVFVAGTYGEMAGFNIVSPKYLGLALKVKSISGGLKLDQRDAYFLDANRSWVKRDLTDVEATDVAAGITYGTRYYATFWESLTTTGIYYYRATHPVYIGTNVVAAAPQMRTIATTGVATATTGFDSTMFTISATLNEWYDVNSIKLDVNSNYPFGANSSDKFFSMTKYQNQLLMANQDIIWFSDTTLGGWIEQFNAANTALIGDREYGRITAICGTSDFLFVSRERKNYYVTGNLVTGNYRVQEVSEVDVGAWCNNSAIKIKDSVMFITSAGIYQMVEGGRCIPVSQRAPKNFDNFSANNANEDVVFRLTGANSALVSTNAYNDFGLSVAFDAYRDLLVWMRRTDGNPAIVVHTKTGELYEWNEIAWGFNNMGANCLAFIRGSYYFGTVDKAVLPTSALAFYANEDKTVLKSYQQVSPAKLYTSWLSVGEPSLEKELLQLKMFGRISASTTYPLTVKHYKDWDYSTAITNSTYVPLSSAAINSQVQYSHKKRLNSDKCLAASVGIEGSANMDFEIESFEVEFNTIQAGMKR